MEPQAFEADRARLVRLAYRMVGSVQAAEDIVQEAAIRFADAPAVAAPRAWCTTVVTRLCLDELRSARVRREQYVGPWLPEPEVERAPGGAEDLSIAFLALLERLSPAQRAAYVLRELFDEDYDAIAEILELTPAAVRQLVHRAREQLGRPPRYEIDPAQAQALVAAFVSAAASGDLAALRALLAEDVVARGDSGGHVPQAGRRPVHGADRVARLYVGLARKLPEGLAAEPAWVNGHPALLLRLEGSVYGVTAFEVREGRIVSIASVLNPDKLAHVA